ncbi:MAG: HEAT repeat domain-containing protein [Phycisphaerales bacterium]|nr:HEAT repeat domain-containing protein [Phycisphaerales bacterium]
MGDATNTNSFPGFDRCVEFIRSGNDAIHEDGYFWLVEHATDYVSELIALAENENDDSMRVTWIELLGDTCSERCVEILIKFLSHQHGSTRVHSVLSLETIDVPVALKAAENYRETHPDEFQ